MPRDFFQEYPAYFFTGTVVGWMDVFTRSEYAEIFVRTCNYCVEELGMVIYAYVIMPGHFHMLASNEKKTPGRMVQSLKAFTAKTIIEAIEQNPQESRKEWLLSGFKNSAKRYAKAQEHQFWQHRSHPSPLWSPRRIGAALDYIHMNPVVANYVNDPTHWRYSSALDYAGKKGLVKVEVVDSVWMKGG